MLDIAELIQLLLKGEASFFYVELIGLRSLLLC
jgi:hypothetical protein